MFRMLLTFILFVAFAWTIGLVLFVEHIPTESTDATATTDAIVVLTGGEGRVEYGFHLMEQGKAKTLFISGVGRGVTKHELLNSYASEALKASIGQDDLVLDYVASNTQSNATETAAFMHSRGYQSMRLVTAGYHMTRSLFECQHLMPDVNIVPDPVSPVKFRRDQWWRDKTTRRLVLSEYHKYWIVRARTLIGEQP